MKKSKSIEHASGFSDEERAAMRERARELKAEARTNKHRADAEGTVLDTIAEMPEPDRSMATRIHAIVKANAPELVPKLWYGMPAYARDGRVVCFFQAAHKFKVRYATLGFTDAARLDEGAIWPTAFALADWTAEVEARVIALVKQAAG